MTPQPQTVKGIIAFLFLLIRIDGRQASLSYIFSLRASRAGGAAKNGYVGPHACARLLTRLARQASGHNWDLNSSSGCSGDCRKQARLCLALRPWEAGAPASTVGQECTIRKGQPTCSRNQRPAPATHSDPLSPCLSVSVSLGRRFWSRTIQFSWPHEQAQPFSALIAHSPTPDVANPHVSSG